MKNYTKKVISFILIVGMVTTLGYCGSDRDVKAKESTKTTNASVKSSLTLDFSKESGVYKSAFSLKITSGKAAKIYYTTDGSNPVTSKTKKKYSSSIKITDRSKAANYVSAVDPSLFDAANVTVNKTGKGFDNTVKAPTKKAVDKCTVIRAVAVDSKGLYTDVVTNTYFVGSMASHIQGLQESCKASGTDLAVISLSIDYSDLFNSKTGIYVKGDIYNKALKNYLASGKNLSSGTSRDLDANYKQTGKEWEKSIHMDYFESNGNTTTCELTQDCGIRIQGNFSRSDLQKSFRLYAREDYGKKNFEYAFFGDNLKNDSGKTMTKFKTLTLRNGGNCAFTTKYSDTYWQSLIKDLDCETQTSRPCVVYVDGEYWGLYVLQEDYSEDYFEKTHGVNEDDVVLYKGDAEKLKLGYKLDLGDLPDGINDESYYFKDLLGFFKTHDNLASDADFKEFVKLVDVESARDYFAAEVWVNNKWDWPDKNWSMWKTSKVDNSNAYADGKWRFCFYDMEFGGVSGSGDAKTNTIKEDNYMPHGLLDKDTPNPAILTYAYLMTNESFRKDFETSLLALSKNNFNSTTATAALDVMNNTYSPLYDQFFARYSGSGSKNGSVNGSYASYKCIKDFLQIRENYIHPMLDFVNNFYSTSK